MGRGVPTGTNRARLRDGTRYSLPTVIAVVEDHLKAGQSVVLQLVTTAEAILDRRLSQMTPEERAETNIDLIPPAR